MSIMNIIELLELYSKEMFYLKRSKINNMVVLKLHSREQDFDISKVDVPIEVMEVIRKNLDILDRDYGGLDNRPTGKEDGGIVILLDLGNKDDEMKSNYENYLKSIDLGVLDIGDYEYHDEIISDDNYTWYADLYLLTEYGYIFIYKLPN